MHPSNDQTSRQNDSWLCLLFIIVLSFFTYAYNFGNPAALFWDENYHISSAQKYLNGVSFMEPHPPLGKLLIALGEKIVHPNALTNQFINTDYAQNPPAGFSFVGFRLFPTLLAWWTAPLLFVIFLLLTRRHLWAMLLSFLYVFDNALIVHQRAAMLESTMLFFGSLTILAFLWLLEWNDDPKLFRRASILFGAAFGCLLATKAFGLIFILVIPFLAYKLRHHLKQFCIFLGYGFSAFLVLYCGIWYIHFALGTTVNPSLPDKGYYQASPEYKTILDQHRTRSLSAFPVMLRDSLAFVTHYEKGVPRLDMCKKDENGSPWFYWPFGARSISYRWESLEGGNAYRYMYLQVNPVIWLTAFIGLLLAAFLLLAQYLLPSNPKLKNPFLLTVFFTLYVCFLIAVSRIDRVMYLYHYFLPLFFTFFLFALVLNELEVIGRFHLTDRRKTIALLSLGIAIFLSYQFYRPFTYYEPLTDKQFAKRNIVRLWDLKCVRCDLNDPLVVPK